MLRLPDYERFLSISADGAWDPAAIPLGADARRWAALSRAEAEPIRSLLAGFLIGEHAVAEEIEPFAGAAGDPMLAAALRAQEAEEDRHRIVFDRIWEEVLGVPAGEALARAPTLLDRRFADLFREALPRVSRRLADDPGDLGAAVSLYHGLIEGVAFQAGQDRLIALASDASLDGIGEAVSRVQKDERWHVAFGMRMLSDLGEQVEPRRLTEAAEGAIDAWGPLIDRGLRDRTLAAFERRLRACGLTHPASDLVGDASGPGPSAGSAPDPGAGQTSSR